VRSGYLTDADSGALGRFVIGVALPAPIFVVVAGAPLDEILVPGLLSEVADLLHARRALAAAPPAVADPALVADPGLVGEPQLDPLARMLCCGGGYLLGKPSF
jgi:hypothetical protein